MADKTSNKAFAAPLLALLFGAGLALLFAPRSGKDTRSKIRQNTNELKQRANGNFAEIQDSIDQVINNAQEMKQRLLDSWGKQKDNIAEDFESLLEDSEKSATAAKSSILSTWEES